MAAASPRSPSSRRTPSSQRTPSRGFTLIELIVVVTILGILSSFVVPRLDNFSPKYRMRAAARILGSQIGWARSMAGGTGEEYVLRYDLDEQTFWIILPPGPEDDPDLHPDDRDVLEDLALPDKIEIEAINLPDGRSEETGTVDIVFDAFGNSGSHIVVLVAGEELQLSVKFSALIGVIDYFPGEKEFEDF